MIEIKYDNTIPEIKSAFSHFQKKYALPKMIPLSIAYIIAIVFGVDFIARDPAGIWGYILTALGAGMFAALWSRPFMTRKRLIATIEGLNEETYKASFYDDKIIIETEIIQKGEETEIVAVSVDGVDTVSNEQVIKEVEHKTNVQPEPTEIGIATEELFSVEDEEKFCLFVNRALIYIFPKRCLTNEKAGELRNFFREKNI